MKDLIEFGSKISRNANCHMLDDCSGKTISRRTGIGLRKSLCLNVSLKVATDITHFGMAASVVLLTSKDQKNKTLGKFLAGGLFLSYLNT